MRVSADIARYGLHHTKFRCRVLICSEIGESDVEKSSLMHHWYSR